MKHFNHILLFYGFLLGISINSRINAQAGWEMTFGQPAINGRSVYLSTDSNYLTVSFLSADVFATEEIGVSIAKVNPAGKILWEKQIAGLTGNHLVSSYGSNGILHVGSYSNDSLPFQFSVININNKGEEVSRYSVPLSGQDNNFYGAAIMMDDGSVFIAYPNSSANKGIQCLKYDYQGKPLFSTLLPHQKAVISDKNIELLPNGNFVLTYNSDSSDYKRYFASLSSSGQLLWNVEPFPGSQSRYSFPDLTYLGNDKITCTSPYLWVNDTAPDIFALDVKNGNVLWHSDYIEIMDFRTRLAFPDGHGGLFVFSDFNWNNIGSFVYHFSGTGEKLWIKSLNLIASGVTRTNDGNYVCGGSSYILFSQGAAKSDNVVWLKFDIDSNTHWTTFGTQLSGIGGYSPKSFITDYDGNLISFGSFGESLEIGSSLTGLKPVNHMAKLTPDGKLFLHMIKGHVYSDSISNCSFDSTEFTLSDWFVQSVSKSISHVAKTNVDGEYRLWTNDDSANVQLILKNNFWGTCKTNYVVDLSQTDTVNFDIPATTIVECPDMDISIGTFGLRRCDESSYFIEYANNGPASAINLALTVTLDSLFEFINASISPVAINGNVLTFLLGSLGVDEKGKLEVNIKISCDAPLSHLHCTSVKIIPGNLKCFAYQESSGSAQDCRINVGSFDPNNKEGFLGGRLRENNVEVHDEVEYQINFQNTGTDFAYSVRLEDVLSDKFDLTSFIPGASSHPFDYKLQENGKLWVIFFPIDLPPKIDDELGSSGFFKFKIKVKPEYRKAGTELLNSASIIFDGNAPIITNTHRFQFATTSTQNSTNPEIVISPNPCFLADKIEIQSTNKSWSLIRILNNLGVVVNTYSNELAGDRAIIDIAGIRSGNYLIQVVFTDKSVYAEKLVIIGN